MLVLAVVTVGAGGHAGQADELPPAEGRPRGSEFLAHGLEILFAMQPAARASADAALAASIFHYNEYGIPATKAYLAGRGVPVRL